LSRHDRARLDDIVDAVRAIQGYLARGDLQDGLIYDAVRVRLIEIGGRQGHRPGPAGEMPSIPWREIARMRDHLAHR
jgi:uncharacterized protein with HEPN domain